MDVNSKLKCVAVAELNINYLCFLALYSTFWARLRPRVTDERV